MKNGLNINIMDEVRHAGLFFILLNIKKYIESPEINNIKNIYNFIKKIELLNILFNIPNIQ
jgi:hypothetical protein